jgi:type I restriction enzyme S subunit
MPVWPKVKLADCVELLAGFAFKSQHFTDKPSDIALVKGENVSQGCILWDISKRWPASDWKTLEKFQLRPGDVVVAMDRPWIPAGLKWAFIRKDDPKALLVQRCARLRAGNGSLDQDFLRFVIGGPGFENYVKPITTGVNVPHISGQQILDFEFRVPPLPVQRRIAGILSAYDELLENNRRRIRLLEAMTRALYREWFVRPCQAGKLPKGYEAKMLGDLAEEVRRTVQPNEIEPETPYFGLEHLPRRSIALTEWGTANEVQSTKHAFKKGEILFGKIRPYFHKVGVAPLDGVSSSDAIVIRPKSPEHFAVVLGCVSSDHFVAHATQTSQGTKMPRANWDVLTKYPVALPPKPQLQQFSRCVEDIVAQLHNLIFKTRNLRRTRDLLLPRLLSGQVELGKDEG